MCSFSIILILKKLGHFKVKESTPFIEKDINFNKNETESKKENPT